MFLVCPMTSTLILKNAKNVYAAYAYFVQDAGQQKKKKNFSRSKERWRHLPPGGQNSSALRIFFCERSALVATDSATTASSSTFYKSQVTVVCAELLDADLLVS